MMTTNEIQAPVVAIGDVHGCASLLREAMEKQGNGCPLGWFSSGRYCLQNR